MSARSDEHGRPGRPYTALVETHLWTAAQVTSLAAFSTLALDLPLRVVPLVIVFAATLFIYNVDRVFDLLRRERVARRGELRATAIRCGIALAVLLFASLFTSARAAALVTLGTLVCSAYGAPLGSTRRRVGRQRLKDVPGLKAWFVGVAVAAATVLVPMADAGRFDARGVPIGLLIAGATIVNAHMFDVRDRKIDRKHGVRTLPVLLGLSRTRLLLSVIAVALTWIAAWLATGSGTTLVPHAAVLSCALLVCIWRLNDRSRRTSYGWWVDGLLLLPLLVSLSSNSW